MASMVLPEVEGARETRAEDGAGGGAAGGILSYRDGRRSRAEGRDARATLDAASSSSRRHAHIRFAGLRHRCARHRRRNRLPGTAAAESPTLNSIKATGTITFGYRDNAVPFSFKNRDGRIEGYSVELCMRVAGAIQKELGLTALKIEWVPVEASNRLDYVISGKVDAVCGTTTITLGRMQKVDFSLPIYVDGGTVLVRARSKLTRIPDLKGKRVAVIAGTTTEEELARGLDASGARAVLVQVKTAAEGMALLDKGSVDGYAADRTVLAYLKTARAEPECVRLRRRRFFVRALRPPHAPGRPRFQARGEPRAGDDLPHRRHRWHLPALAGRAGNSRPAAARDVLPQRDTGVTGWRSLQRDTFGAS